MNRAVIENAEVSWWYWLKCEKTNRSRWIVVESGVSPTSTAISLKPNNEIDCWTRTKIATAVTNPRNSALLIKLSRNPNLNKPNASVNIPVKRAVKLAIAAAASGSNGCLEMACWCAIPEPTINETVASGPTDNWLLKI